jgi:hypothetical protein
MYFGGKMNYLKGMATGMILQMMDHPGKTISVKNPELMNAIAEAIGFLCMQDKFKLDSENQTAQFKVKK